MDVSYHSLIRHYLLDITVKEGNNDSFAISANFFSCPVCE